MKDKYKRTKSRTPLVFWLNEEDVQNVAKDKLGRELTNDEIKQIVDPITDNIEWFDAISTAIDEHIENHQTISG